MTALTMAVEQAMRQQQQPKTLKRKATPLTSQSQTKKVKPIAERVLVVRFDPDMTETDRDKFKAFLKQTRMPVYMHHPTHKWISVHKFFRLTPKERIDLIKGFFEHDDLAVMKEKIKDIEKVPKARIHHAKTLQQALLIQQ